jgi:hypothetical protein
MIVGHFRSGKRKIFTRVFSLSRNCGARIHGAFSCRALFWSREQAQMNAANERK